MVLAVLVIVNVLLLRQYQWNATVQRELREDLILLSATGHVKPAERMYQKLVIRLPSLSDEMLMEELARTGTLVDEKTTQLDNLVWKYHWAVKRNLEKREDQRLARALKRAEKE